MRASLPCVLLVLGLLGAGLAAAQASLTGGVTARFEAPRLEVPLGSMGTARLVVENDGIQPRSVNVTYHPDPRVTAQLDTGAVLVAPGDSHTFLVHFFPSPALPLGNLTVAVRVQDGAAADLDLRWHTVPLQLALVPGAPPAGAPLLTPHLFPATELFPNESVNLTLGIRHAAATNQTFVLDAVVPRGWAILGGETRVDPNASGVLTFTIRGAPGAENGTARLLLKNKANASLGGVAEVPLTLRARAPPPAQTTPPDEGTDPPPPDDPQPPPASQGNASSGGGTNATTGGASSPGGNATTGNATGGNRTQPPPAEDDATRDPLPSPPGEEHTLDAAGDAPEDAPPLPPPQEDPPQDPAPQAADPGASPPAARLRMRVEPGVVPIAPGGVADARLVLESDADVAVRVRLDLPPGLAGSLSSRAIAVPAGEPIEVPFLLQADPGLPNGTRLAARVEALDAVAEAARFEVLVTFPQPPVELVSLSAPGSAGGHALGGPLPLALLAAGVGAASLLWTRRRWVLAFAGLYARLRPSAVLEHPVRQRLVALFAQRPGLTLREAQRELDLANGAMTYHLRTLEKAGLVRVVPDGMLRRVYPAGHPRVAPVPPLSERVLDVVRARGEATPSVVAEALGVSRQSVHYHLQRMVRDGTLRARVHGRETYLRAGEPREGAPAGGSA